jgi:hypothetical protein
VLGLNGGAAAAAPHLRRQLQPLLWLLPALLSIGSVFGYGIYRLVQEALQP